MIKKDKIILATSSPYRQEAFRFLGIDFIAESSEIDEYSGNRPQSPKRLVLYLAKLKTEAVAKKHNSGIIIGFDSVGLFQNQILEKPKSRKEVFNRLKSLSGNIHQFYTGIYIKNIRTSQDISKVVRTKVFMRNLTIPEINKYLNQDPRFYTYSLSYDPLCNYSSTFVKKIEGSYNNFLRGIPLETIIEMLSEIGYKI